MAKKIIKKTKIKTEKKENKKEKKVKQIKSKTKVKVKTKSKAKKEKLKNFENIQPTFKLEKNILNPIISPNEYIWWEGKAVFNPAALFENGLVHLIYRAIGHDDNSYLGYLNSDDGINFDVNKKQFCYSHKKEEPNNYKINYLSGGGGEGGCEDPRITKIDNKVYLLYTAFNGWDSVRIAMTHISLENFNKNIWNWSKPVFISPPGQIHKNWVLFPEKVNGKYAIMHAITPKIMIEYVEDLNDFDGETFIYSIHQNSPMWSMRDKLIRGVGPTPIKTENGWLVFYHGMDEGQMHKYKLFAMLLDLNDPTKIIAKSKKAILEPSEVYENSGIKPGIVYSCGAIVKDDLIYIYYGAADNVICLATVNYLDFIEHLKNESSIVVFRHNKIKNDF